MAILQAKDIEALENTSFAAAFPYAGAVPTEGIVCIDSVACVVSNDCSNGCIDSIACTMASCIVISEGSCLPTQDIVNQVTALFTNNLTMDICGEA